MKNYETYKDSGVQWVGMIPSHWTAKKMKYACQITDGTHFSPPTTEFGMPYITVSNVRNDIIDIENANRISVEDYETLVKQGCQPQLGDVLLAKDGTVGRTAIVTNTNEYVVLSSLGILHPEDNLLSSFLKYSLDSLYLQEQMNAAMAGSALRRITISKINEFLILVPPIKEQSAISAYLDCKIGKIDAAITEKEQMLEDLKAYRSSIISETVTKGLDKNVEMKDSGIEWLGMIPQKWGLVKLKNKAKVNGRIGFRGYTTADLVQAGEGAYTIGGKHITNCVLDLSNPEYISWDKYYESPEIMVHKGDILMAQRGSLGKTALVREDIGPATINPSLVLLNSIEMSEVFLYYYLISNTCLAYIDLLNTATAVPMISQNQIENIYIPIPSHEEQAEIASFLDEKTTEINNSISLVSSQIVDLKAYKSAIITEAVTGKFDLRDWIPNKK